jgi:diguanylate cyclase (GGDEF)-like protein/PAS domain S-box-containing protein
MKEKMVYKKRYYFVFTFYFLGFGVVVALITSLINYNASFTDIDNKLKNIAKSEMAFKRDFLIDYIDQTENLLSSIARNDLTTRYLKSGDVNDKKNLNSLFYALSYANKAIMQLRYLDADGKEVIRIDRDKKTPELLIIPENKMQDKSQRYYFQETSLLMANQFWHSNIDLNVEHGKIEIPFKPTFRVAMIVVVENQFKGIIIANILFENTLKTITNSNNFHIYLIDKDGEIIHHPDRSGSWSKYLDNKQTLNELFPENVNDILNNDTYSSLRLYSYTFGDLFRNRENLKIIFIPKSNTMEQMQNKNIIAALLIAVTVILVSLPLSWLVSITPSRLQSKLASAYEKIRKNAEIINKHVMISTTNKDSIIIDVSTCFTKITGYTADEVIGKKHNLLRHHDTPLEIYRNLWKTILNGKVWEGNFKNYAKNGNIFWVHSIITPNFDESGEVVGFTAVSQDITDKINNEIMAVTDNLTGLYNRRKLSEVLAGEMARSDRHKSKFSVIIFDIDFFKKVNDTYGHQVGDNVLIHLSNILKESARETDCVSRWGGEEFLIIAGGSDLDGAFIFAEKIRKKIADYDFPEVGRVTISCGVAQYKNGETSTELVLRADTALYQVKNSGRNRVEKG